MIAPERLALDQLQRMRSMTALYHRQFFRDVQFEVFVITALFVAGFTVTEAAFLLIPVVALYGAVQTAFDANYLHFARHYSARLEGYLNKQAEEEVLVGGRLENTFLYPLHETKIVTAGFGRSFTYFGFVTLFFTAFGLLSYVFGLLLGWSWLGVQGDGWSSFYFLSLAVLTTLALLVGWWWFVYGEGERRLAAVLDSVFH
jgi:hypothetical protein